MYLIGYYKMFLFITIFVFMRKKEKKLPKKLSNVNPGFRTNHLHNMFCSGKSQKKMSTYFGLIDGSTFWQRTTCTTYVPRYYRMCCVRILAVKMSSTDISHK